MTTIENIKFGTDGVRGEAGSQLTADFAVRLGRAAANVLRSPAWLLCTDTRESAGMLSSAFSAGLASAGAEVHDLGVLPTAGASFSCSKHDMPGVALTASHNPYRDNGFKFFSATGHKLDVQVEQAIEAALKAEGVAGTNIGRIYRSTVLGQAYRRWLTRRVSAIRAQGIRVGIDCANGSAYEVAPEVFRAASAEVHVICDEPDGRNINDNCGSTYLERLRNLVLERRLDLGFAFDGDADRVLAVDAAGEVVDGDQLIALLAVARRRQGRLPNDAVVVSEWSNLGLRTSLNSQGIQVHVTDVGDRSIAAEMTKRGAELGGEQSGHIILRDLAPTGDGISTAIEVLAELVATGMPFDEWHSAVMTKLPQAMENVPVDAAPRDAVARCEDDLRAANEALGMTGRLVLRASGTERVVRVMAEAASRAEAADLVNRFAKLVAERGSIQ